MPLHYELALFRQALNEVLHYVLSHKEFSINTKNLHAVEAQRFAQNAATALIARGKLVEFFRTLEYDVVPYGEGFKGLCPVCRDSAIFIGLKGDFHKIYWKCYSPDCKSRKPDSKLVKNILGLTRALVDDGSLVTAMKAIASFLGARHTYDVTNGRLGSLPAGEEPPPF